MLAEPGRLLYCRLTSLLRLWLLLPGLVPLGGFNPRVACTDGANMVWPSSLTSRRLFNPQAFLLDILPGYHEKIFYVYFCELRVVGCILLPQVGHIKHFIQIFLVFAIVVDHGNAFEQQVLPGVA